MQTVATNHIYLDEEGRAWIDDTNIKVIEVVLDKLVYGWIPEEIQEQHPHLSLTQIHAALSYYYDHQAEIDSEIEQQDKEIEALMEKAKDSPLKKRLRNLPQVLDKEANTVIDVDRQTLLNELSAEDSEILARYCAIHQLDWHEAVSELLHNQLQIVRACGYIRREWKREEESEKRRA